MKNKKVLRVFSASFLLGTLLITNSTFAADANNELQLGDSNISQPVKSEAKIPNRFKSELKFSDFSQNFDLNTWFINNYVPATGYKDTYNNYEQVCAYTNYTFNLPTKDKNGNYEKFALSIGAAILHAGSGTDYENMALKHMNTGNDTFEKYSQVTGDLAHIYYKDKMKYNKDNAIKAIQTEQDGSYFGDMYKKSAGMTFNISDKFTKEMIIPSHKEAFTNKSTYMRDLKAVEKAAVDYYTQKYGKPTAKTFVIQTRDDYNGIRNITLPPNLSEDFYTEYGGLQVTSRNRFDKDLNQSFDEMALSAGTTFAPYHNHFFLLTDGKYKADPSLPYKQVKKDTSGKRQLMEFDEFFDNKIEKPDVLARFKKALTSTYLNPNTISDKPIYTYVGNVEKTTKETPYKTIKQNDPTLKKGETKVKIKGVKGKTEIIKTYEVVAQTGELKNPKESSKVISKPVDEVILVGTMTAETKEETKTETVKFEKETRNNPKLKKGETKVVQKGVNGIKEIKYKVTYENGKEIKREKISEKITKQPVKEIIEVGTLVSENKKETKTETIKFEKETKENPKLKKGETKVIQKGINGEKTLVYDVTYENGKEVKRVKVSETITKEPVKEIIEIGTLVSEEKEDIKTEPVKFETEHKENPKLEKGQSKVIQKGIDGEKTLKYKVIYENGKEVKRELIEEKVTKKPVKEIIEVGTLAKEIKEDIKVEEIKFETEHKENPQLKKGHSRIAQKGVKGETTYKYKVIYENGKEVKRELIEEKVTKKPVKEIIEIGTLDRQFRCEKKIEIIKHECKHIESKDLERGHSRIAQKGEDGEKTYVYEVIYENGKEKSRKLVGEKITKEVKDEIIEIGIKDVEKEPEKPVLPNKQKPATKDESTQTEPEEKPEEIDSAELEKSFTKDDKKPEQKPEEKPEQKPEEIDSAELEKSFTKDNKKPEQKPTTRQESSQGKKPADNNYRQIEQAKKPEPKQNKTPEKMPKAGIDNEITLLAAGALSIAAGLATLRKKRK